MMHPNHYTLLFNNCPAAPGISSLLPLLSIADLECVALLLLLLVACQLAASSPTACAGIGRGFAQEGHCACRLRPSAPRP